MSSNENPDLKTANFTDVKLITFKTQGYRKIYVATFGKGKFVSYMMLLGITLIELIF